MASGAQDGEIASAEAGPVPSATPDSVPVAWFAERAGPFDLSLNGDRSWGGPLPLLLIDGIQVPNRSADDPRGMHPGAADLTREDFRKIWIATCALETNAFGEAGRRGVILAFTHAWDGPMPRSSGPVEPSLCRRRGTR